MAARSKASKMDVTGIFHPAQPNDVSEVLTMFAIAARVVVLKPDDVNDVTRRLSILCSALVPPELHAAQQCARMWTMFARVATAGKPALREQAGRAFVRDLDQVGRALEVPPIEGWDALPRGVEAVGAVVMDLSDVTSPGESLESVKKRAAEKKKLDVNESADLVRALYPEERDKLFVKVVGEGVLSRSDVSLLVRWLAKGEKLGNEDEALAEVLTQLGIWLVK